MITFKEIMDKIESTKRGTYISLTKVKDLGNGVIKESDMRVRIGVEYSNMNINAERETGSLPWGQWVKGLESIVVEHKGNYYLRVTSTTPENPNGSADVIATRYIKDSVEISREDAESIVGAKKMGSKPSVVYNIKFDNIVKIK